MFAAQHNAHLLQGATLPSFSNIILIIQFLHQAYLPPYYSPYPAPAIGEKPVGVLHTRLREALLRRMCVVFERWKCPMSGVQRRVSGTDRHRVAFTPTATPTRDTTDRDGRQPAGNSFPLPVGCPVCLLLSSLPDSNESPVFELCLPPYPSYLWSSNHYHVCGACRPA